jgi:hypothetical protein
MKNYKKLTDQEKEAKLQEVGIDINNILALVDSLGDIDEEYDVDILENKINDIQKNIENKYKDILEGKSIKDLDIEEEDNTE